MSEERALTVVDGEAVDVETGEVAVLEQFKGYAGVATLSLSDAHRATLAALLSDEEHDILPTGEVYVPQVHYRRKLNKVFGPGGWALVPRGGYVKQGKTLCREYALVAQGRFISESTGEADYHEDNARMSYASAAEAVKSNAIMRCCKDLGIGWECWDARWCERFKRQHCVKVWRKNTAKPQWRRKDAEPWWDEKGQPATQPPEEAAAPAEKPKRGRRQETPPSQVKTCKFCDSPNIALDTGGNSWHCQDCNKGGPVER